MSSDETSKPGVPDSKAVADKIADTAAVASHSVENSAVAALKNVDRTILRVNRSVTTSLGV